MSHCHCNVEAAHWWTYELTKVITVCLSQCNCTLPTPVMNVVRLTRDCNRVNRLEPSRLKRTAAAAGLQLMAALNKN